MRYGVSLLIGRWVNLQPRVGAECGATYRLRADMMQKEFDRAGLVLHLLLRYTLGPDDANGSDCRRQQASFARPTAMPLALAECGAGSSVAMLMTQKLIAHMLGGSEG